MGKTIFHIETLSNQGCGVAKINDKKFIIPFTLPGEEVEAEPIATKKNLTFCRLVHVIQSSPKRIEPRCRYFGQCGGCDLQHMAYENQLEFKQNVIKDILSLHATRFTLHTPIVPSPKPFNYRNRITLHSDGKWTGYYKPFSHEIVPIEECALLADDGIRLVEGTKDDNHSHFTQINTFQNKNLIDTVLGFCSDRKWKSILELYCGAGNLTFHLADVCKKITAVDLDVEAIRLAQERQHEIKNGPVIARTTSYSEGDVAIHLNDVDRHDSLNESRDDSHRPKKHLPNIKFIASSAHDAAFRLSQDLQQFDLIVCDPPREGLKETATLLPRLKPKQIVYVSCDPQTFVNDVKLLEHSGYKLTDVVPIDMFPQTYHVEVVGLLVDSR